MRYFLSVVLAAIMTTSVAQAAPCSDTGGQYEDWKPVMAAEAAAQGVGDRGIAALMGTSYSKGTISADRNQKSFKYSLEKFMEVRGAAKTVEDARKKFQSNPDLYASLENAYGVPAGVLLAIHGMETNFGVGFGQVNVISATATLTYDCRRSDFFYPHLIAALTLVDRGSLATTTKGAAHGEIGHTQFLPKNALLYGVDGNGDGSVDFFNEIDALASTANFLAQKGWRAGAGYQEGEPNFAVLNEWNAATVYQKAIAIMGAKIDG